MTGLLKTITRRPCLLSKVVDGNSTLLMAEPMQFISSQAVYRRGRDAGIGINITKANSVSHAVPSSSLAQRDHGCE